jgi:RNA polymerase sigma factor (sigma-70 family)
VVCVLDITEKTDEELAAEAARENSDGPAFTALVSRHQGRVWRVCFKLMGNEHDASDAAQEVFVSFFQTRGAFAGRAKFSTWLYAVALRTCLKLRRARGRRQRHEAESAVQSRREAREAKPPAAGQALDLAQMLDTLDDEDRALVVLKYAEGYGYDELAALFNLSVSACKMRVSRARDELQGRFPEQEL